MDDTSGNRHARGASHQSKEVHGKLVVEYPILGYTMRIPASNFCPLSHANLLHAVFHRNQHGRAPPVPTQTIKGSLLCRNTQVAPLPSTYPSLQRRRQEGGLSLPHMAAT